MDEILFRSSQRFERFQVQLGLAASQGKDTFHQYSEHGKSVILNAWNNYKPVRVRDVVKEFWIYLVRVAREIRYKAARHLNPHKIYITLIKLFGRKWTVRDVCFACAGFIVGGAIGIAIGLIMRKKQPIFRYMQAIQCLNYLGPESVVVSEDAIAPYYCDDNDVLINVKAASVHVIDADICGGYGRTLRRILLNLYQRGPFRSDLPVILGRDCTGIVTDVGRKVKRLEVGDEVWLTVPFWAHGTLCQTILAPEYRVSRKPRNVGFEGACSIPYAGSIALSTLQEAGITFENAQEKRVFIQGGCTPIGCSLIQILKHWGADVTTTCFSRAMPVAKALGADDIIIISSEASKNHRTDIPSGDQLPTQDTLPKELEIRDKFDVIINTRECSISLRELRKFCKSQRHGKVMSTLPPRLPSDNYGVLKRLLFYGRVRFLFIAEKFLGVPFNVYEEAHLCYSQLDELTHLVEDGHLQTVVDKVLQPHDIEIALGHIPSPNSIGSTVITFR